jgi:hypothetical protein
VQQPPNNVRFQGKSGHRHSRTSLPLLTQSGHFRS